MNEHYLIVDGPQEVDLISQGTNFVLQISLHQIRRVYILRDTQYSIFPLLNYNLEQLVCLPWALNTKNPHMHQKRLIMIYQNLHL